MNVLVPPFSSRSVLGRPTGERLRKLVDAVAERGVSVRVAATLPLTAAEAALEQSRGGRLTGKLVLIP
jgi:NADPH:quinone reductase-like Zn-dependent oxidoreductase